MSKDEEWCKYAKKYDPVKIGSIDGTDTEPHDRAIVRAINSEYRPNKFVKGRPENTIFVSNLNPKTTKDEIRKFFAKFGEIKRFRLVRDIVTGFSKGYAFIEYEKESYAEDAYRRAYKADLDGNDLFVDFECERLLQGWKPRRLGGGFGGMKESGQIRFGCRDRPFKKPIQMEILEQKQYKQHSSYSNSYHRDKSRRTNRRDSPTCSSRKSSGGDRRSHSREDRYDKNGD